MTPEDKQRDKAAERAEKIVFSIFHEPQMDHPDYEKLIAAEIRDALREGIQEASSSYVQQGYKDGLEACDQKIRAAVEEGYEEAAANAAKGLQMAIDATYEDAARILEAYASRLDVIGTEFHGEMAPHFRRKAEEIRTRAKEV